MQVKRGLASDGEIGPLKLVGIWIGYRI